MSPLNPLELTDSPAMEQLGLQVTIERSDSSIEIRAEKPEKIATTLISWLYTQEQNKKEKELVTARVNAMQEKQNIPIRNIQFPATMLKEIAKILEKGGGEVNVKIDPIKDKDKVLMPRIFSEGNKKIIITGGGEELFPLEEIEKQLKETPRNLLPFEIASTQDILILTKK